MNYNKRCSICGKRQGDDKQNFVHVFLNGQTWDNRSKNMIISCVHCMKQYKLNRMNEAVKTLYDMGLIFDRSMRWKYNNRVVRSDTVDVEAYEHQIKYLKQQIKDMKYQMGIKQKKRE